MSHEQIPRLALSLKSYSKYPDMRGPQKYKMLKDYYGGIRQSIIEWLEENDLSKEISVENATSFSTLYVKILSENADTLNKLSKITEKITEVTEVGEDVALVRL